ARVLESPTGRWSTYRGHAQGIDCSDPAGVPDGYGECCNPAVPKTIQERAWSSPIWYHPEGVTGVRGTIRFRSRPNRSVLSLGLDLGALPIGLDPSTQVVTIAVRDDDDVFQVTAPAGALRETRPGRFVWKSATSGVKALRVGRRGPGTILRLRTDPLDLSTADRVDHFMEISLRAGNTSITTTPLWRVDGSKLVAKQ